MVIQHEVESGRAETCQAPARARVHRLGAVRLGVGEVPAVLMRWWVLRSIGRSAHGPWSTGSPAEIRAGAENVAACRLNRMQAPRTQREKKSAAGGRLHCLRCPRENSATAMQPTPAPALADLGRTSSGRWEPPPKRMIGK